MKRFLLMLAISGLVSCEKKETVYAPVGFNENKQRNDILDRAKKLNLAERAEIQNWIKTQDKKYYPTALNYWIDLPNPEKLPRRKKDTPVSYEYQFFSFGGKPFYAEPTVETGKYIGHIVALECIQDALIYIPENRETELLVPSVLAFGTYGDGDHIKNDTPLIIKLKILSK